MIQNCDCGLTGVCKDCKSLTSGNCGKHSFNHNFNINPTPKSDSSASREPFGISSPTALRVAQ